jgi:transposase
MANQLKMADVQSILTLHKRGWSARRIGRELGINRETVNRHIRRAGEASSPGTESKPASEVSQAPAGKNEAERAGLADASSGPVGGDAPASADGAANPSSIAPLGAEASGSGLGGADNHRPARAGWQAPPGGDGLVRAGRRSECETFREVIQEKLDAGLTAQRVYQDLVSDHDYGGSYYSVRRLARKLSAATPLPCRRMECEAGAEAQVDFGRGAPIVGTDGKRRGAWVFRIVLSHSRKAYSEAVTRQTTDDFLRCLENAFIYFGGVPRTIVIDNLRAAVKQADWYEPELCPKLRAFAEHYQTVILPTRPRKPQHKGKIENGVGYVKGNGLRGRQFASLADQNRHLLEWETSVADKRIHGTTRKQVEQAFRDSERKALLPLPAGRFENFSESVRNVHRDGHVEVARAYYSVPPEFVGRRVWARWDGRVVRVFDEKMQQIALHARQEPGRFSTQNQHIATEKINSVERGAAWQIDRAATIGPGARAWAEAMVRSRGVEGVRALAGLHALRDRHECRAIDRACGLAHAHGALSLRVVRRLLQSQGPPQEQGLFEFASESPVIRPLSEYARLVQDAFGLSDREGHAEGGDAGTENEHVR